MRRVSCKACLAPLRELEPGATYPVQVGKALTDAAAEFDIRLTEQQRDRDEPEDCH